MAGSRACLAQTQHRQRPLSLHLLRRPKANAKNEPKDAVMVAMAANAAVARAAKRAVDRAKADAAQDVVKDAWEVEAKAAPKVAAMPGQTTGEKVALKDERMAARTCVRKVARMAATASSVEVRLVANAANAVTVAAEAAGTIAVKHPPVKPTLPLHCLPATQNRSKPARPPTTSSAASAAGAAITVAAAELLPTAPRHCHRARWRAPALSPPAKKQVPSAIPTRALQHRWLKAARVMVHPAHRVSAAVATATVVIDANGHPVKAPTPGRTATPLLNQRSLLPVHRTKGTTSHPSAAATSASPPKRPPLHLR